MVEKIKNSFYRLVLVVLRSPIVTTCVVSTITIAAIAWLFLFSPLRLDTDLAGLLPSDLPCVAESKRISQKIGSIDYLVVAVESPVPEDNEAFSNAVIEKIRTLPEIGWAANREDRTFFRDRSLLYMDVTDLKRIVSRVERRFEYEKKKANPFYVSLEEETPPSIDFSDIIDKYSRRLKKMGASGIVSDDSGKKGWSNKEDYLASADGKIFSVIARPKEQSTDITFAKNLLTKVDELIEESNPHRNKDMRVEIGGPYRNRYREYQNISHDIFSSIAFSLCLIAVTIIAYFRRVRAVGLVFIPLIISMILTAGFISLTLGRLSITTALIFAVLMGLGIDFGVHLTVRYLNERSQGTSLADALSLAVFKTGKAAMTAALTTVGAMIVLCFARFKGFSEFGIIATAGIAISFVVYILLLPALATLFERVSVPKPWRKWKQEKSETQKKGWRISPRLITLAAILVAVVTILGVVFGIFDIRFEYNFRRLRGDNISATIKYGKSLGHGSSSSVALLDTQESAKALTRKLERIIEKEGSKTTVNQVLSLFSFIPENQNDKLPLLKELKDYADRALRLSKLSPEIRGNIEKARKWGDAEEITVDNLPEWVKDKFREIDGTLGRIVFIYPKTDEWNVLSVSKFYKEFGTIEIAGHKKARVSASGFIFVEVVQAAKRDGWILSTIAVVMVFFFLLADFRSLKRALFVYVPLLVGLSWTALAMVVFDIRIGLYNLLVVPTVLGIGIDASVHLYHAYMERGRGSIKTVMRVTGSAVLISSITTGLGFLGAMMTTHNGLRSIGILALLGISICTVATILTMPLLINIKELIEGRKKI